MTLFSIFRTMLNISKTGGTISSLHQNIRFSGVIKTISYLNKFVVDNESTLDSAEDPVY